MRPARLAATILLASAAVGVLRPAPLSADVTDTQVRTAIERMKAYLYAQQDPESGTWQADGTTALVANALLVSGDSGQNPKLQRAIAYLQAAPLDGTYEVAVRAHVWAQLPATYLPALERDMTWLIDAHDGQGRYRYTARPSSYDHSATQYAVLGMWEATKRGARVPAGLWSMTLKHFLDAQNADGGWGYQADSESKVSMTAAGLTVLAIAQQELYGHLDQPPPALAEANSRGLGWLDRHFDGRRNVTATGGDGGHPYYALYSVERVALANGVKHLGGLDWFQAGARFILEQQATRESDSRYGGVGNNLIDTAFSLLFLARGHVPTWITKLAVPGFPSSNRPNDVNRLTAWISDLGETEMNWQLVDIEAPVGAMLNTPMAYLSSDAKPELTESQAANLKRFLDLGGLLLACPEHGATGFRQGIRRIARLLYPQWPMRKLPLDHPLYQTLHRFKRRPTAPVQGVHNGVRDLILMPDSDWGRHFQADPDPGKGVEWQLAANLYTLATGRGLLPGRLVPPFPARQAGRAAATVAIGRARCQDAAWQIVEPEAWTGTANHLFNRSGLDLEIVDVDLELIANSPLPLVHLAGIDAVTLSDAELKALSGYVAGGGTVLAETVGGHGRFAASIERQLDELFGTGAISLSGRSPLISGAGLTGGEDIRPARYRRYAAALLAVGSRSRIAAYHLDERPAVIISHEDLTLGMMGVRRWGILGYRPDTARRIASNVLLAAVQHRGGAKPEVQE